MNNGRKIFAVNTNGTLVYYLDPSGNIINRLETPLENMLTNSISTGGAFTLPKAAIGCFSEITEMEFLGDDEIFIVCGNNGIILDATIATSSSYSLASMYDSSPYSTVSMGDTPRGLFPLNDGYMGHFSATDKKFYKVKPGEDKIMIHVISNTDPFLLSFEPNLNLVTVEPYGATMFGDKLVFVNNEAEWFSDYEWFGNANDMIVGVFTNSAQQSMRLQRIQFADGFRFDGTFTSPSVMDSPRLVHSRDGINLYFTDSWGLYRISPVEE